MSKGPSNTVVYQTARGQCFVDPEKTPTDTIPRAKRTTGLSDGDISGGFAWGLHLLLHRAKTSRPSFQMSVCGLL